MVELKPTVGEVFLKAKLGDLFKIKRIKLTSLSCSLCNHAPRKQITINHRTENSCALPADLPTMPPLRLYPASCTLGLKLIFGRVVSSSMLSSVELFPSMMSMSPHFSGKTFVDCVSFIVHIRKIKSGVFPIPDYLNKSVVSLLCHMLQTDPMKRATVEDVRKHEWFLLEGGCPSYLFPDRVTDTSIVDTDAIAEV